MKALLTAIPLLTGVLTAHAQLQWIPGSSELPANAVMGGRENGTNQAVCRAFYKDAYHSGKTAGGNCSFGWGGEEIVVPRFEVLVNNGGLQVTWDDYTGTIPKRAVTVDTENGRPMWVGIAEQPEQEFHIGKIIGEPGAYQCNYSFAGKELVVQSPFRILTATPISPLFWDAYNGSLPDNAVSGGKENGTDLAVCRGEYKGATHPGKVVAGKCNIGYGGKEIELTAFELLLTNGAVLKWQPFTGKVPKGAVQAGIEKGKKLYVGQITRPDGSIHSGKIFSAPGGYVFNYGYGGKEITAKSKFRILVQVETGGM